MIRLQPSVLDGVDTLSGLQDTLQQAIELEHATIPPYLYAYYSFSDNSKQIPQLIDGIAIEEMGHMALACNVLNAIGGSPVINQASFVPDYPGPLPGGVEGGLTVGLAPFSIELVESTFMVIEEPEQRLDFAGEPPDPGSEGITIGQFYDGIENAIEQAGESIFVTPPHNQVTTDMLPQVIEVASVATAIQAIEVIKDQGEGTAQTPDIAGTTTPAHYYRFAEIAAGKTLIPNPNPPPNPTPDQEWVYGDPPIPFEASDVLPLKTNPKASDYSGDAATANNAFNSKYSAILNTLHDVFNGKPGELQGVIFNAMPELSSLATTVTAISLGDGTNAGPTFEFQA